MPKAGIHFGEEVSTSRLCLAIECPREAILIASPKLGQPLLCHGLTNSRWRRLAVFRPQHHRTHPTGSLLSGPIAGQAINQMTGSLSMFTEDRNLRTVLASAVWGSHLAPSFSRRSVFCVDMFIRCWSPASICFLIGGRPDGGQKPSMLRSPITTCRFFTHTLPIGREKGEE